jgi:hypothetical protein
MNIEALLTEAGIWILRTSWEASFLLLLMGLLLFAGKRYLPPRLRLILWGVVCLRFLLSVVPEAVTQPERRRDREWARETAVSEEKVAPAMLSPVFVFSLVRLAARRWRNEREILCDDAALRRGSVEAHCEYGSALIRALESRRLSTAQVALLPFISRKNEIKQRLLQIMKNPSYPVIPQVGVALLAYAAAVMTFTSAAIPLRADEEGKPRPEAEGKKDNPGRDREVDANKPKEEEGAKRKEGEGDKPAAGKKNSREQEIFDAYDKDADGTVTAKEMEAMMEGKQNSAGRRELRKAVDQADKNADGKLNLEEFEFWYKTGRFDPDAENR